MAQDESGFTVLEMLVALCILGLLSAYTMQTFQRIRRMDKVLDSIERKYTVGAIEQHLRTIVATARPAIKSVNGEAPTVDFEGEESHVQFVVASDGILERGGLLSVEMGTRNRNDQLLDLITRRTPYHSVERPSSGEELVLLEQIMSFGVRYYGQLGDEQNASWHSQWKNQAGLPRLLEVTIVMPDKERWSRQKWMLRPVVGGQ